MAKEKLLKLLELHRPKDYDEAHIAFECDIFAIFDTLWKERNNLAAWKESMLEVESQWDSQAVARELGISLGLDIRSNILPKVIALREERDERDAIIKSQICQGCDKNRLALADELAAAGEGLIHIIDGMITEEKAKANAVIRWDKAESAYRKEEE